MATITPVEEISSIVQSARSAFNKGITKNLAWRKQQLNQLKKCVQENEKEFSAALYNDLKMNEFTAINSECEGTYTAVNIALDNIDEWAAPERRSVPLLQIPGKGLIYKDPVGVVLILSAFNYPLTLITRPLVGAIAAGNAVVLKPSEVAAHTAKAIQEIFPKYLDMTCIKIICGGIPETTEILKQQFDHILYTGNGAVGRIIMKAAAEFLTPVTLELGGKSPCIVDKHINVSYAAHRITWGKFFNAGQTCIAPDYILVHKDVETEFIEEMKKTIVKFYGNDPKSSPDFAKIINERHLNRVKGLLKDAGDIVVGGETDVSVNYMAPTLVHNVNLSAPIMKEEIFGPVLPIIPINNLDDAVEFVNSRPKPLALYVFSNDTAKAEEVFKNTSSGGGGLNECLMHNVCPELPFGGVGPSGMGAYNGKNSFDTFTHRKGILQKPLMTDPPLRYPPYTESKVKWVKFLNSIQLPKIKWTYIVVVLLAVVVAAYVY